MTTRTLLVDWLGRGGIAQATEAWAIELGSHGHVVEVVTRPGRELGTGQVPVVTGRERKGRFAAHVAVVNAAARRIRDLRPDWVVVQNYVIPPLERPVFSAARAVGAKVAVVVHDGRLHTWREGMMVGQACALRVADAIVVHTEYVAARVRLDTRRSDVTIVPMPIPLGMLSHSGTKPAMLDQRAGTRWCGHFGIVRRRYKGTEVVEQLGREGVDGWQLAVFGTGARSGTGLHILSGFLEPGDLVAAVSATDVTLAPYTHATQSAVVVLAHVLGSVPVASAVGGIPEQIDDGADGLLIEPHPDIAPWRQALNRLRDDDYRKELAVAGVTRVWADHAEFIARITGLLR